MVVDPFELLSFFDRFILALCLYFLIVHLLKDTFPTFGKAISEGFQLGFVLFELQALLELLEPRYKLAT
jgi:hypothetical protein